MPVQPRRNPVRVDESRNLAMIDLLAALNQSLAVADDLRLPMVGVHLDQAIHALMRQQLGPGQHRPSRRAARLN